MSELGDRIRKTMVEAISEYEMLAEGDKVLVAVSGGKDSSVMLSLLEEVRKRAPFTFSFDAVLVDQKQPGFDGEAYRRWVEGLGINFHMIEEDTYSIVVDKTKAGKAYCSLCSRLRRGILYNYAEKHGYTKIALGHHRDDLNETLLLNMFYAGKISSMPPKLHSDDGRNTVIRPLCFVPEKWIIGYVGELNVPIIPCNLCGSQDGLKRKKIKALLSQLEEDKADIGTTILTSQKNIRPSQLLDRDLWKFS